MNVNTSSSGPMVTLVMTGEFKADKTTVYGFLPPDTVSPQGSQVFIVVVTFGVTFATEEGGGVGGIQLVSEPAVI